MDQPTYGVQLPMPDPRPAEEIRRTLQLWREHPRALSLGYGPDYVHGVVWSLRWALGEELASPVKKARLGRVPTTRELAREMGAVDRVLRERELWEAALPAGMGSDWLHGVDDACAWLANDDAHLGFSDEFPAITTWSVWETRVRAEVEAAGQLEEG